MSLVKASLEYVFDASLRVHDGAKPCLTLRAFLRFCHFVRGFCAAACPAAAAHHLHGGRARGVSVARVLWWHARQVQRVQ